MNTNCDCQDICTTCHTTCNYTTCNKYEQFNISNRIIQYNNIVFSHVEAFKSTITFKNEYTDYTWKSGAYYPFFGQEKKREAEKLSLSIEIPVDMLNRKELYNFKKFARKELLRDGIIWKIMDGKLYWTYAVIDSTEVEFELNFDGSVLREHIDLTLITGEWYEADAHNTFIVEYDLCEFSDNLEDSLLGSECISGNMMHCSLFDSFCIDTETSYCANICNIPYMFEEACDLHYMIIHDCEKGKEIFGCDWGQKICEHVLEAEECFEELRNLEATILSSTEISSPYVELRLIGSFIDPIIRVNDVTLKINGEFNGLLIIDKGFHIQYYPGILSCQDFMRYADAHDYTQDCDCDASEKDCFDEKNIKPQTITDFEICDCNGHFIRIYNGENKISITGLNGDDCHYLYVKHRRIGA